MPDEVVTLKVNGKAFSSWESMTLTENLDEVADAFSFSAGYDPNRPEMVEAFRPFGYQPCTIDIDGELILTGRIEQVQAGTSADSRDINVQGRSLPGVLVDCGVYFNPNDVLHTTEWRGLKLGEWAKKLATPYGIKVTTPQGESSIIQTSTTFSASAPGLGKVTDLNEGKIDLVRLSPGDKIADALVTNARPMGWLWNSSPVGELQLVRSEIDKPPMAHIIEGQGSFLSASLTADGTKRFSVIRVLNNMGQFTDVAADAADDAVTVPRLSLQPGAGSNAFFIQTYANWARALTIADSIQVEAKVTGWKTDKGELWRKGACVRLQAPGAFITQDYEFIIAGVTRELSTSGRTTSLRLVLPATYTLEQPATYPWDVPKVPRTISKRNL